MIALSEKLRPRHLYIIGKTQSGKSTLLVNIMRQDIRAGRGLCFIDPNNDTAVELLKHIPKERLNDTIYFEPTTIPIGIQCLGATTDAECHRTFKCGH